MSDTIKETIKNKLEYLKEVNTEQDILNRLEINIYKYKKMLNGEVKASEESYYLEKINEQFKLELSREEELNEISIETRIKNLLNVLKGYYSIVKIGEYIGVSDTHLHRILDNKDKIKYSIDKLEKFEQLYYGTEILKEEEISYYPHTYKKEYAIKKKDKFLGIEKHPLYKEYDVAYLQEEIPNTLSYLRNTLGIKAIEIARRLEISNTAFHFAYKGKLPKNPSKLMTKILIEFQEELSVEGVK